MGRTKGSGALKLIDDQDAVEIRRILDAGGKPERDPKAQAAGKPERWLERAPNVELLIRWRSLRSQRDDCTKRIAAKDKTVTKWTHKTRKRLNREIEETWQQLGAELAKLEPQQLADALARLANAARAPAFPWQKRATELVAIAMLRDDGSSRLLPTKPRPNRELVEQRKSASRLRRRNARPGFLSGTRQRKRMSNISTLLRDALGTRNGSFRGKRTVSPRQMPNSTPEAVRTKQPSLKAKR